jgi:hypothetical protein
MQPLSKDIDWDLLQAVAALLASARELCPERIPAPGQATEGEPILTDEVILRFFQEVLLRTGMDRVARYLEGLISEWMVEAIEKVALGDFDEAQEAFKVLAQEGEASPLAGFEFWPPSVSWDDLADDLVSGRLPMIVAFSLEGSIAEFLSEDADPESPEGGWAGPALAMSLAPYLNMSQANWDADQIAKNPLQALLAGYFDYNENPFLGEASRGEAQSEWIPWSEAPGLVKAFEEAEPVWSARPNEAELADPWYIFRQAVQAFRICEGGKNNDEG